MNYYFLYRTWLIYKGKGIVYSFREKEVGCLMYTSRAMAVLPRNHVAKSCMSTSKGL